MNQTARKRMFNVDEVALPKKGRLSKKMKNLPDADDADDSESNPKCHEPSSKCKEPSPKCKEPINVTTTVDTAQLNYLAKCVGFDIGDAKNPINFSALSQKIVQWNLEAESRLKNLLAEKNKLLYDVERLEYEQRKIKEKYDTETERRNDLEQKCLTLDESFQKINSERTKIDENLAKIISQLDSLERQLTAEKEKCKILEKENESLKCQVANGSDENLVVRLNELIKNQNELVKNQNELVRNQKELIENENELYQNQSDLMKSQTDLIVSVADRDLSNLSSPIRKQFQSSSKHVSFEDPLPKKAEKTLTTDGFAQSKIDDQVSKIDGQVPKLRGETRNECKSNKNLQRTNEFKIIPLNAVDYEVDSFAVEKNRSAASSPANRIALNDPRLHSRISSSRLPNSPAALIGEKSLEIDCSSRKIVETSKKAQFGSVLAEKLSLQEKYAKLIKEKEEACRKAINNAMNS